MSWYPGFPGWDGIHPVIAHAPVVLFVAAAMLLAAGLFARESWRGWLGATLLTMAAGAIGVWFVTGSGHAAGQLVDRTPELERAILRHEALGVVTRNLFTGLTVLFAVLLAVSGRVRAPARIAMFGAFLLVLLGGTTFLANTANLGIRLVHEHGVRAVLTPGPAPTPPVAEAPPTGPARS
jgi:uncharacterized membrane protein